MDLSNMLRSVLRRLTQDRSFTVAAVLALGLGIGGANTVFTLLNGTFLRGLPSPNPEEIVQVAIADPAQPGRNVSQVEFLEWAEAARSFSALNAYAVRNMSLAEEGRVYERFLGTYMTGGTFQMLGEAPLLGRGLQPADDRPEGTPVVVLGYRTWQHRYAGDPSIIGRLVRVNGAPAAVVGVMREGFNFPASTDVWAPLISLGASRDARVFDVVGRLATGTTAAQAKTEVTALLQRREALVPGGTGQVQATVDPFTNVVGSPIRMIFNVLAAAVALLLVIGCVNVANLLLARGAIRRREVAIRLAIGGSRRRIVTQLISENAVLALAGGLLGFAISLAAVRVFDLLTVQFADRPYWFDFTPDVRVLGFLGLISLATVLVFGIVPAFRTSDVDAASSLTTRETSDARPSRWMEALVVVQLAMTLALLTGAALMTRSVLRMLDPGFDPTSLVTMRFELPPERYATFESRASFVEQFEARLETAPPIQSAAAAISLPMWGAIPHQLATDGRPETADAPLTTDVIHVGPHYFEVLDVPVLRGRSFAIGDGGPASPVAIINDTFASAHFPGIDPIGQQVRVTRQDGELTSGWATIVGVVPALRQRSFGDSQPLVYLPSRTLPSLGTGLIIRTTGDSGAAMTAAREIARTLEPDITVFDVESMEDSLAKVTFVGPLFGSMLAAFAAVALVLCTTGLYAVTAYAVSRRTHEVGVRMALGARARSIQWLILRRALVQLAVGIPIGLAGAVVLSQVLTGVLASSSAGDPRVVVATALVLTGVMLVACFVPAHRAARLDPMAALRQE